MIDTLSNPPISLASNRKPLPQIDGMEVDPRDIDKVLSEMAAMIGRWNLFRKFLLDALKVRIDRLFSMEPRLL